ncbi:DUF2200 domain-containing protein [Lactiplantibacillus paraxiangfangensis]|uniref:DUF2200 domain-containing protein n=1 Tax=Lactiplantibacillus paraxiangfangensis TaxID=3076224 RepID=UPI0030C72192
MANPKLLQMPFSRIYDAYVQKLARKGQSEQDLRTIITWLTGYSLPALKQQLDNQASLTTFFTAMPQLNKNADKITGVICGVRVESITDPLMQRIRYLDKLVDELARGKAMTKILRS